MSKLTLEFPHMDKHKTDLKMLENMLHSRLGLAEEEIVHLYYTPDDPCLPVSLVTNDDFIKFWDNSVADDKDFIHLVMTTTNSKFEDDDFLNDAMEPPAITIDYETPKKIWKMNKKPVSKEKPKSPRRSPRFQASSKVQNSDQQGPSRKLCFVDLLNIVENMSCLSEASRVGTNTTQGSSQPSQEKFNHDYWVNITQGSSVDNEATVHEDEDNVQIENTDLDECNPVEDPDAPLIFDSDEDNEIGYDEYVKSYKVPDYNEESSSSEDEDGSGTEIEDKDGGDPEVEVKDNGGPQVEIDKAGGKPGWHNRYQPDINNIGEDDDPSLFPEEDEIPQVNPDKMLKCKLGTHKKGFNRSADPELIKDVVIEKLRQSSGSFIPKPRNILEDFAITHNIKIPYICAWKARNLVLEEFFGNYEESYAEVPKFCSMVSKTNPGFVAKFTYGRKDFKFESMTISFAAPMKAFQESCRGVVGFDACHLTGKWGGVLMAATTLDGENRLVSLGISVVRSETKENWLQFLKDLAPGILAHHSGRVTFISDQQKGLLKAVAEVFPGSPHRYCWRHNYKNLKKYYKSPTLHNSMWNASKCCKIRHFERQFRGFPCQHVVSALKTISPNWAEYCSPYYSVDCYRTTYVPPVFPLEDIADYPDRPMENKILHPPSPRKHGRPTSKRRRSYDEPQAEVRKMRCTQCGSTDGHNKRTCKGGDVGKNQTGYRPRTECDAANFSFTNTNRGETSTARGKAKKQGSIICW